MTEQGADRRVGFDTDGETLFVRDELADGRLRLEFDRDPDPRPALTDLFPAPVDEAVSFEAASVSIPSYSAVTVRDAGGEFIAGLEEDLTLPRGSYCFDVSGAAKALIRATDVDVEATGMVGGGPVEIAFDRPTTVTVGGRSLHTRPEATITVPDDPAALMTAVSALGSSVAEWSPERSWPTLRGYPPRIVRGDALDVPDRLRIPDTGVSITVPATFADVYRVTPLAYYLGAAVEPGAEPALRLDTGYVEPLPADGTALEDRVAELLRTTLFLDSLARTEGYVPSDRHEYERVGADLPFYPPKLAPLSMSDRLMEYLEVDPETVDPYVPAWPTAAVLRPGPAGMELLGHLAHSLTTVRVRGSARASADATTTREPARRGPLAAASSPYLPLAEPPRPDATPLPSGAAALSVEAYENRLSRTRPTEGDVHVAFVVPSPGRAAAVHRAMSRSAPLDGVESWTVYDRPTRGTIDDVVSDPEVDLLYCGLPTDRDRIACAEGVVAVGDLDETAVAAVFEGAGTVAPASGAVAAGAVGAVAVDGTLDPDRIRALVGLLASGTPMAASVALARVPAVADVRLAGDPGETAVVPAGSRPRHLVRIRSSSPTEHYAERHSFPSMETRLGAEYTGLHDWDQQRLELLGSPAAAPEPVSEAQILEASSEPDTVVDLNGRIVFGDDGLTAADIERSAREALADETDPDDMPGGVPFGRVNGE